MKRTEKMYYNFHCLRSYYFETHDADGNQVIDITESEWREKVANEIHDIFSNNNMSKIQYVFHLSNGLHVHIFASFEKLHRRTSAVKILLAGSLETCKPCENSSDYLLSYNESRKIYILMYDECDKEVLLTYEFLN